jgi:hypothetical protein
MKHVTTYREYNLWQREDGTIEAWKSKKILDVFKDGTKVAKDLDRKVLSATDIDGAMNELDAMLKEKRRNRKKNKPYDPYKDPTQTRIE